MYAVHAEPDAMPEKRSKVTVLLTPEEYARVEAFCSERGHQKSTLVAWLIRDHLNSGGAAASSPARPRRRVMLDSQAHPTSTGDDSTRTPAETRGAGTMRELRTRWRELCSSRAPRCSAFRCPCGTLPHLVDGDVGFAATSNSLTGEVIGQCDGRRLLAHLRREPVQQVDASTLSLRRLLRRAVTGGQPSITTCPTTMRTRSRSCGALSSKRSWTGQDVSSHSRDTSLAREYCMTVSGPDFRQTWLWRQAFLTPRSDSATEEQEFFKTQYLSVRERAAHLVSRIPVDSPGLTVHDISHLDALWDAASSVAEGAVDVNPAETFVLGASILLHDAGMSLAAYPGGLPEVRTTVAWKDAVARVALASEEKGDDTFDFENPPATVLQRIVPDVLRQLHAQHAEELAEQAWRAEDGPHVYLVEDSDLRRFYGPTIGRIAHSHWWSVQKLDQDLSEDLGALANRTRNRVDRVKLACLLRIADALHLDSRRAPRFLRAITHPSGTSARHWSFQERWHGHTSS